MADKKKIELFPSVSVVCGVSGMAYGGNGIILANGRFCFRVLLRFSTGLQRVKSIFSRG